MTATCLMSTYQPLALSFTHGLGTRLWDQSGREYLDAVAGVAVTNVGHSHPLLVEAIRDQAGLLLHTSNLYTIDWQKRLAQKLTALSGLDAVFFNNSGAEANETALKLARLHGWHKYIERPLVVVMENAFHGRTLGTLSASDGPAVRLGFSTLPGDYIKVPFGDLAVFDKVCTTYGHRICAVLVEPIQGEGGAQVAPAGYLKALRERCTRRDWLLMLDEIQTGMGRTGKWFAFQHEGIVPDVMTLAKGLGNGIPIGACLARGRAAQLFTPGSHGSTFGGNPLACRVGCAVIDIIERGAGGKRRTARPAVAGRAAHCAGCPPERAGSSWPGFDDRDRVAPGDTRTDAHRSRATWPVDQCHPGQNHPPVTALGAGRR